MSNYIVNPFFEFGPAPPGVTRNAWVELNRTTLGSPATTISVVVPKKRYLMVLLRSLGTSADANMLLQFNGDTGNNYSSRNSLNGGVDVGVASTSAIIVGGDNDFDPDFGVVYIDNNPNGEKLVTGHDCEQAVAGAGNVPNRREAIGKWDNALDQITTVTLSTTTAVTWNTGSEVVVLGFDPADLLDDTANFWEELASSPITQASPTQINVVFSARKYLWIQCWARKAVGGVRINLRYNNDSTTKYSLRSSSDGGVDGFDTNETDLNVQAGPTMDAYHEHFVVNEQTEEKLGIFHSNFNGSSGAGIAPNRNEGVSKYIEATAQITALKLFDALGADWDDAFLKVWGHI